MRVIELSIRSAVRCAHLIGRPVEQLAIVIAADIYIARADKRIRRGSGLEWTREVVSEVYNQIRRLLAQVRLNGLEGPEITVDVRQNGDPHILARGADSLPLWGGPPGPRGSPRTRSCWHRSTAPAR